MTKKKTIKAKDLWEDSANIHTIDEAKPIFSIETEQTIFKANDLTTVMHLYKKSEDNSNVLVINVLG